MDLAGKTIIFSGQLSLKRSEAVKLAAGVGAKVASRLPTGEDVIVTGLDDVESSKLCSARERGATIITEQEFKRAVGWKEPSDVATLRVEAEGMPLAAARAIAAPSGVKRRLDGEEVDRRPVLHLSEACSSAGLEAQSHAKCWGAGKRLTRDVDHGSFQTAPPVAGELAKSLHAALAGTHCPIWPLSKGQSATAWAAVISKTNRADYEPKAACVGALQLLKGSGCQVFKRKWKKWLRHPLGFSAGGIVQTTGSKEGMSGSISSASLKKATAILAEELTDQFLFRTDSACGPLFFGGFARDGNIVGVLTCTGAAQ